MEKNIPDDPREFNELLLMVDRQLVDEGVRIPWRPISAIGVISAEFGIPLPLSPMPIGLRDHPAAQYWPISKRIRIWYDCRYGDRLKVHLGFGRMAILIENDVWVFRFPGTSAELSTLPLVR